MVIQWSSIMYFPCILFITYLKRGHLLPNTPDCNCFYPKFEDCKWPTQPNNGAINAIPAVSAGYNVPHLANTIQPPHNIHSNPTPSPVIPSHMPNVLQPANSIHLGKHTTPASRSHRTTPKSITPSHGPKQNQPPHNIHATKPSTPTTGQSVNNPKPLIQPNSRKSPAVNKAAKNSTENLYLTNENETIESPLLLSSEDSIDNFPIIDLMNSSSPVDTQHSDNKVQVNSKNSYHFIKSVQKSVISNKVSTVHNHHNIQTKTNYMKNPYIIVGIVALAAIVLAIVIAGIVVHRREEN